MARVLKKAQVVRITILSDFIVARVLRNVRFEVILVQDLRSPSFEKAQVLSKGNKRRYIHEAQVLRNGPSFEKAQVLSFTL